MEKDNFNKFTNWSYENRTVNYDEKRFESL